MDLYYDTEFIDDGRTIDLISIGMQREDGREYYAVSSEFSLRKLARSDWLVANVWPSLPQRPLSVLTTAELAKYLLRYEWGGYRLHGVKRLFNTDAPEVKPRRQIASEVAAFILDTEDPQLWAWYAAYDHVALAQLFGPMVSLPAGVPMFTNDLKQEAERLGNPRVPQQAEGEHNALADARHNHAIHRFLKNQALSVEPVGSS